MPDNILQWFQIGAAGLNIVNKPQDLGSSELAAAQNAEILAVGGEGAIDQRPGMTAINSTSLGAPINAILDVQSNLLTDYTQALYVGTSTGWQKSLDGVTWAADPLPTPPGLYSSKTSLAYWKRWSPAVTIGNKMYWFDGNTTIGLHSYDGATDHLVSFVPPSFSGESLSTPSNSNSNGSTKAVGVNLPLQMGAPNVNPGYPIGPVFSYTYAVVLKYNAAHSAGSPTTTVSATISNGGNQVTGSAAFAGNVPLFNVVSGGSQSFTNLTVDVYRTATTDPGLNTGKIGTAALNSSGNFLFNDTGLTGDSTSPPGSATGATTYTYRFVATAGASHSANSVTISITSGYTTLSTLDFNTVIPDFPPIAGAAAYDVYRTAGGGTTGKIGTIPISAGTFSTGNGSGLGPPGGPAYIFTDGGLTGDSTTAPTTASGATESNAIGIFDVKTDSSLIYVAVFDGPYPPADPLVNGRLLTFDPVGETWQQLGSLFPTATGNGSPGAIGLWGGALNYATYAGLTSTNPAYITTTGYTLPAGGVQGIVAIGAGFSIACMTEFQGALYAGFMSLKSTNGGLIIQYGSSGSLTVVVNSSSAPVNFVGTGAGFTSLYVWNGRLFALFVTADGATNGSIYSSADGVNWVFENGILPTEQGGQFIAFQNNLYIVLNQTGQGFNTQSQVIKRNPVGTWSNVLGPYSGAPGPFTGTAGIVYIGTGN
jgi:hypothetical protein